MIVLRALEFTLQVDRLCENIDKCHSERKRGICKYWDFQIPHFVALVRTDKKIAFSHGLGVNNIA